MSLSDLTHEDDYLLLDHIPGSKLLLFGSALSGFAAEDCDADMCLWFSGECAESGVNRILQIIILFPSIYN